jgi:hypothetical protein
MILPIAPLGPSASTSTRQRGRPLRESGSECLAPGPPHDHSATSAKRRGSGGLRPLRYAASAAAAFCLARWSVR